MLVDQGQLGRAEHDRQLHCRRKRGGGIASATFEYLLLGIEWCRGNPRNCALVMFSMYLDLQGEDYRDEATLGLLYDVLPGPLAEFLAPRGTEWDCADRRRSVRGTTNTRPGRFRYCASSRPMR